MKARLVWLLLCGIWGSTWLFIKLGLEALPPITFAGIRFVISSIILFVLIRARNIPLPGKSRDWLLLLITGVMSFTLNYGLVFWGEQYISSGLAALVGQDQRRSSWCVWRRRSFFKPARDCR
jgi:drug/metabolite transporter (DMT)-like permease